jgi:mono/diheme cytochrome c family protein
MSRQGSRRRTGGWTDRGCWRAGAMVCALAGLGAAGLPGCSTPGDDPGPALPVEPAAIYAQMCARCHGIDGRGDPEMKKTMPVKDFSDPVFQARASYDAIASLVMAGKNQMPAFGGLLSAPKIQAISGYVKRVGRTAAVGPRAIKGGQVPAPGR